MFLLAPTDRVTDDLSHRPRLAREPLDKSPEPRPRERSGQVANVDLPFVEEVDFEGLRMFIKEREEANYSGIVASKPPSMIDPSSR